LGEFSVRKVSTEDTHTQEIEVKQKPAIGHPDHSFSMEAPIQTCRAGTHQNVYHIFVVLFRY
jgi:hypothetical protein